MEIRLKDGLESCHERLQSRGCEEAFKQGRSKIESVTY